MKLHVPLTFLTACIGCGGASAAEPCTARAVAPPVLPIAQSATPAPPSSPVPPATFDLMTHVSGYRDYFPLDFIDREMKQPAIQDDVIARYGKRPLDFEPRTRFSYSSTGYKILGRVSEKVTRQPLGTVLTERILRPVGMGHSSYMPAENVSGVARGYTSFALGPPEPAEFEGRDWGFGAGGIFAPAGDIARWDIALMSGEVLGPADFKTFTTARRLADGRMTAYGCGIGTTVTRSGETVLRHSGQSPGFVAYSVLLPRTKSAVVALSNRDDAPPWDLVNELVALISKEHRPAPPNIAGASAREVARDIFAQLQSGHVDRNRLGDDFNAFLADPKLRGAGERLRALGEPSAVDVEDTQERGGMEEATVRFTFGAAKLEATMFRSVDGKVQQFLISKP
jgi:D-alanyl-D-alanine carboxypeptidase